MRERLTEDQRDLVIKLSNDVRAQLEATGRAELRTPSILTRKTNPEWVVWDAVLAQFAHGNTITYPSGEDDPFVIKKGSPIT